MKILRYRKLHISSQNRKGVVTMLGATAMTVMMVTFAIIATQRAVDSRVAAGVAITRAQARAAAEGAATALVTNRWHPDQADLKIRKVVISSVKSDSVGTRTLNISVYPSDSYNIDSARPLLKTQYALKPQTTRGPITVSLVQP